MTAAVATAPSSSGTTRMEQIAYDDRIVRYFVYATVLWGVVGMLVGVTIALQMAWWPANLGEYLSFGRLRPLHTNSVIFAFAGNTIFAGVYHSTQRLVKARMASDLMSRVHFWGWQLIIVAAAITLPMGFTTGKEYAELEWPIDIAIAVVWVIFAINFFWTLKNRREPHLYVAIWFYIATIVTVAVLHIVNSFEVPVGILDSYSLFGGAHDALVQWWYGHNAVAFFLTTPFLGLMYYYLPKAAQRPVFSYKLSIIHFWSLVFIYIWAGPHHLHYTALPEWASTLGMTFSIMLWMPSWGGMINGLFTLRGAWHKLRDDAVLKFFVVAVTFYGMSTFEGPMLSIKSVNALSHYTDWTVAHVHSGTLGWNGFMAFGMIYWLLPRLWKTKLWSDKWANAHFWLGTFGMILYVVSMYSAGITQGLMLRAFDDTGRLLYGDFMETVTAIIPMLWVRVLGGTMYLTGVLMAAVNLIMTVRTAPRRLDDTVVEVPVRVKPVPVTVEKPVRDEDGVYYDDLLNAAAAKMQGGFHRALEGWGLAFTILVFLGISVGSVVEIVPMLIMRSNIPRIASVKPLTPLEVEGREIYLSEGCYNCHSQMVRPFRHEIERYGEYSKPGESIYNHPFQWGSKRTGPDLARVGSKYPNLWHVRHLDDPRKTSPSSLMPRFYWLLEQDLDLSNVQAKMTGLRTAGVPYTDADIEGGVAHATAQSKSIADSIKSEGGPDNLEGKKILAIVAYLQRLGTDIKGEVEPKAAATTAKLGGAK